jgi:hypothetical protein
VSGEDDGRDETEETTRVIALEVCSTGNGSDGEKDEDGEESRKKQIHWKKL